MNEASGHPGPTSARARGGVGPWLAAQPGRWWLVAAAVSSLLAWLVLLDPVADPDLFARLAVGRLIEVTGGVTDQDPFAFTELRPRWIDHEWLSGVVFYRLAAWGGAWGLLAFNLLAMAAMVALVVRAQEERGGASLGWSLLTLAHVFIAWSSVVRSRAFTLLGTSVLLLALVRWRNGRPAWLWLLPPCFLVWANAHGGFVAGLGLLGAAAGMVALAERRRSAPLWLCLVACTAVTFVNPYGLDYWRYILEATSMERPRILEWQRMQDWQIGLVAVLLGIYGLGAWLRRRERRPPPEAVGVIAVALWAAIDSQRLVNFLLLALAVYGSAEYRAVVRAAFGWAPEAYRVAAGRLSGLFAVALPAGLSVAVAVALVGFRSPGLGLAGYPVQAVEWLDRHGQGGRLLTHFNHGSFAIWRLYPRYRVALDGRYEETYTHETVEAAWIALQPTAPGHAEALRRIAPDYILVPGTEWARQFGAGWRTVFEDGTSAVLERADADAPPVDRPARPLWTPGF